MNENKVEGEKTSKILTLRFEKIVLLHFLNIFGAFALNFQFLRRLLQKHQSSIWTKNHCQRLVSI